MCVKVPKPNVLNKNDGNILRFANAFFSLQWLGKMKTTIFYHISPRYLQWCHAMRSAVELKGGQKPEKLGWLHKLLQKIPQKQNNVYLKIKDILIFQFDILKHWFHLQGLHLLLVGAPVLPMQ